MVNETVNIDEKLEKEFEVTKPLREFDHQKAVNVEINKVYKSSKYKTKRKSAELMAKLKVDLEKSNYKEAPELKKLLDKVTKIQAASKYLKFPFSKQLEDFGDAHVRLIYTDGKIVEPLSEKYDGINRTGMKSATVVSGRGKTLFTLDIINDKFLYRRRAIVPPVQDQEKVKELANPKYGHMWFSNPKRCFILGTEGRTVYVWDSGEITETTKWSTIRPYDKPSPREGETPF